MEYAFLKFNDELKVNINGLGLVPAVSLYPELWQLYLDKLSVRADYLCEVIKELKGETNNATELERRLNEYSRMIATKIRSLGIAPVIAVQKIGEAETNTVVRNIITNEVLYVDQTTFRKNITNEFDIMKYRKTGGKQ